MEDGLGTQGITNQGDGLVSMEVRYQNVRKDPSQLLCTVQRHCPCIVNEATSGEDQGWPCTSSKDTSCSCVGNPVLGSFRHHFGSNEALQRLTESKEFCTFPDQTESLAICTSQAVPWTSVIIHVSYPSRHGEGDCQVLLVIRHQRPVACMRVPLLGCLRLCRGFLLLFVHWLRFACNLFGCVLPFFIRKCRNLIQEAGWLLALFGFQGSIGCCRCSANCTIAFR
mmetsp:Transcript_4301/g.27389  ORF Transcript_4301/g.27389 Transcript_4301/m.27389 type:complete len:225 (+) Transcript_4301:1027-1701(+)